MITLHYQRKLEGFLIEISSEMLKDLLQKVGFVGLSVIFRGVRWILCTCVQKRSRPRLTDQTESLLLPQTL